MSGVLDRMEAAVLHVVRTTGQVPAYLHVACDVFHDAQREAKDAMRSFLVYFPATRELLIKVPEGDPVPVREACRLAPGYIVPVMRLEADRAIGLAGEGIVTGETPFPSQAAIDAHRGRMRP